MEYFYSMAAGLGLIALVCLGFEIIWNVLFRSETYQEQADRTGKIVKIHAFGKNRTFIPKGYDYGPAPKLYINQKPEARREIIGVKLSANVGDEFIACGRCGERFKKENLGLVFMHEDCEIRRN